MAVRNAEVDVNDAHLRLKDGRKHHLPLANIRYQTDDVPMRFRDLF
jgi:hypothetical protein